MQTVELKACPFCGGKAKRITIGDDEPNNAGGDVIACTRCQASSHVEFGRKENLVNRWNTRFEASLPPSAPVGRDAVERMRAVAEGGTINGTYKMPPFASLQVFRGDLLDLIAALALPPSGIAEMVRETFQARVAPWMQECFGAEISGDRIERGDRFLEEALELLQSGGYDRERVALLVDYVWGRPAGEPAQEVGGVMVTLAAYCLAFGLDMHGAGETELARILQPEIVAKIRLKQATKAAAIGNSSPLPAPPADLSNKGAG